MPRFLSARKYLWVLGGLTLGGVAGAVLGVLVFWVHPAVQRARGPLGEVEALPIVVRYPKASPVAEGVRAKAEGLRAAWLGVLQVLGLEQTSFPERIYVYLYASSAEVGLGWGVRQEQERTEVAVVDLLESQPAAGTLARLACSLAWGRPGNPVFPRGLVRFLDAPRHPWAAEAGAWVGEFSLSLLWSRADRLLPVDPWEELYFQANAPWAKAAPSLETLKALLGAASDPQAGQPGVGEVWAAALAEWAIHVLGPAGVRALWQAGSWEAIRLALHLPAEELAAQFERSLSRSFSESPERPRLAALRYLRSGRAEQALLALAPLGGSEAQKTRALALLALGRNREAVEVLGSPPELAPLGEAVSFPLDRFVLVAEQGSPEGLARAQAVVAEAERIWPDLPTLLPDRVVFYLLTPPPGLALPWGAFWISSAEDIPWVTARLCLEAVSPLGLPPFDTLTEGVVVHLAQPQRDFRAEAQAVLLSERWVSLTQPLFAVYSRELAEAEAGALVRFLLERFGPDGVRKVWDLLGEGASPFRAVDQALGLSLYALEEELKGWITRP